MLSFTSREMDADSLALPRMHARLDAFEIAVLRNSRVFQQPVRSSRAFLRVIVFRFLVNSQGAKKPGTP
jgi:hypothetical protein